MSTSIVLAGALALAAPSTGIRCERASPHAVSKAHERELVESLRSVTGDAELAFGADGALALAPDAPAAGGSETARSILRAAQRPDMEFVIEDHSRSRAIAFGEIDEGTIVSANPAGAGRLIWRVRINFDDFRGILAHRALRRAFDPGFVLLHELLHGMGYADSTRPGEIGAVEELLNRVRGELGLPLRDEYFAAATQVCTGVLGVRLRFRNAGAPPGRGSDYLVFLMGGDRVRHFAAPRRAASH